MGGVVSGRSRLDALSATASTLGYREDRALDFGSMSCRSSGRPPAPTESAP